MFGKQFSFKATILSVIMLLTFLTSLFAGSELFRTITYSRDLRSLNDLTYLGEALFTIAHQVSLERHLSYSAVHAEDQDNIKILRGKLEAARDNVDETIDKIFSYLNTYKFFKYGLPEDDFRKQYHQIQNIRVMIDQSLMLTKEDRDKKLPQIMFNHTTTFIKSTHLLWRDLIKYFSQTDAIAATHINMKQLLAMIMEFSGKEDAFISRFIIDGSYPTPKSQAQILEWKGAKESGWNQLLFMTERGQLTDNLAISIHDVKSRDITVQNMVDAIFYMPGSKPMDKYPLTIIWWLELTTQTMAAIADLHVRMQDHTQEYLDAQLRDENVNLFIYLVVLLISIGACLLGFWIMNSSMQQNQTT